MSISSIPSLQTINTANPLVSHVGDKEKESEEKVKKETYEADSDTIETAKKLTPEQMQEIQDQQMLSFKQMLYGMLNQQAGFATSANGLTINQDLFTKLNITQTDSAKAAQAISEDGEWGVNAVATRIMDMAVSLSGGDTSKISLLRNAVEKGFEAAGVQWGGKMPSITDQTHQEITNRFDYWEKNGSLDGYTMEKSQ